MRCPTCTARVKRSHDRCPSCGAPLAPTMRPSFGGAARDLRGELGMPEPPERSVRPKGARLAALPWVAGALGLVALSVAAFVTVSGLGERVSGGVAIDSATFPDAALRAVVRTYDADENGALSSEELAAIMTLDCSNRDVRSLEGVGRLSSLAELDASGNRIAAADLSGNAALTSADLSGCGLASLTLGASSHLARLGVADNALTALDVSGCAELVSLDCRGNQIARLDLARNPQARDLSMDEGQNVTIPIGEGLFPDAGLRAALLACDSDGDGALSERERASLTSLVVDDPAATSLAGLAWLGSLASLDVSGTQVARLSSEELPSSLVSLSARGCPLDEVSLASAQLTSLDLTGSGVASLDLFGLSRLASLSVAGCASLASLDLAPVSGTLSALWCDAGLAASGMVTRTSACFPDEALRALVFGGDANADGDDVLTPAELASFTALDLSGAQVRDVTGLARLTSLTSLTCRDTELASFSCVGLSSLASLTLSGCGLARRRPPLRS